VLGVVANGGSAMSGYAAYARALPTTNGSQGNGLPGPPISIQGHGEPPTRYGGD
jgi:hypothetical protein